MNNHEDFTIGAIAYAVVPIQYGGHRGRFGVMYEQKLAYALWPVKVLEFQRTLMGVGVRTSGLSRRIYTGKMQEKNYLDCNRQMLFIAAKDRMFHQMSDPDLTFAWNYNRQMAYLFRSRDEARLFQSKMISRYRTEC